jgi:diguanylate cyclase (GGDEF)-like protein/PAS domain S-box-containing protein
MRANISKFIGKLTVGRKLALIYFLDLTAVIFISGILINEKYIAIDFARKELVGNQYIAIVRDTLLAIPPSDDANKVDAKSDALLRQTQATAIRNAESRFGTEMGSRDLNAQFVNGILAPHVAAEKSNAIVPSAPFAIGRELLTRVGNQSNLILDPDLDSYYTMSLVVLRFPELLEIMNGTRELALKLANTSGAERQTLQTQFLILEGRLDAIMNGLNSDYVEAFQASSPLLKDNLASSKEQLQKAIDQFRSTSLVLSGLAPGVADPAGFSEYDRAANAALKNAWSGTQVELDRLLQARIDGFFTRMWIHLGTAALLLSIILSLVFFVAKQIAIPIRHLAKVAQNVRVSGDYTLRAVWGSEDEIGRLVTGFNAMLHQLDYQRIAQEGLVAQASAAEAQRKLVDAIPIPLMVTALPDHQVLHSNHAAHSWQSGLGVNSWISGMDTAASASFFKMLNEHGTVDELEVQWTGGAEPTWALVSARQIEYQGQRAALSTFTPINQIKMMESRLELWAKVFEASSGSLMVMDYNGHVITVNQSFCRNTGYAMDELVGKDTAFLVSEQNNNDLGETIRHTTIVKGSWQGEIWIKRKSQESYPAWLVMNAVRDPQGLVTHFICSSLDISERKASERQIQYMAHHDALTGLANRFVSSERLKYSIQQAQRTGNKVAVLFIDLDRFKNINDSLGHHVGDALLRSVADRLQNIVRDGDTVSRLGGDEFVVILNGLPSAEKIGKIVERRLIPAMQKPHDVDGIELYISSSIGIAVFPEDGQDTDTLMRNADSAMYQAKSSGRNNAQFFTPEINQRVIRHLHLESDLRHAVERNELVLYYQPKINAHTGQLAGVESLIRWKHPVQGLVPPGSFIPLAEDSGLIVQIGAWVIREACRQHVAWQRNGIGQISIAVNLSALQLKNKGLLATLTEALAEFPVGPGQIEIELTESILMENVTATIDVLQEIKSLGFSLSIDDFGTGYSSLNYLYRFPIDKLKIDMSFVKNIHTSPSNLAVTKAIIGLGHTLGLQVIAEGVESEADVTVLRNAGCDQLQGYYFARPMPQDQFEDWMLSQQSEVV